MTDHVSGSAGAILGRIERSRGRPLRAMIEISDRCNEVCVHCYQEQGLKGEMSTEQVKRVMDELAELGVLVLTISGGEATLRKDFLELVGHARERGFAVRLFTNGLTMTHELARSLAELAVHLVEISLYSHRAEVHDFVTGVPGSFAKTVAGVRYLVQERVDVTIKTPIMSFNELELDAYAALAKQLGVAYSLDPTALLPREARDRSPQVFERSTRAFIDALRTQWVQRPGCASGARERSLDDKLCGAGDYVLVEPNGEIRPCTMLHVNFGDATRGDLKDYGKADTYADLAALRWSDVHGCRECDLRGYCSRCHAHALAEVGDALAPYPTACRQAHARYELSHGVAPRIGLAPGGVAAEHGPYVRRDEHIFEPVADRVTAADDALAARLGWIRAAAGRLPPPGAAAKPGELVQIRRPGRARARLERIPESAAVVAAADSTQTQTSSAAQPMT